MYPLLETVRIEEGRIKNLFYHNQRMNSARRQLYGTDIPLDLADYIQPESYEERTRCRVLYGREIEKVAYLPYQIPSISSLKIVSNDQISYQYKSSNRQELNFLYEQREACDDILIVKEGYITDTSFCNVAFRDGKKWITPQSPLLEGTCRMQLLQEGILTVGDIRPEELRSFKSIRLFNAMINFGEIEFPVENIISAV